VRLGFCERGGVEMLLRDGLKECGFSGKWKADDTDLHERAPGSGE
jgi:hypothetical protein